MSTELFNQFIETMYIEKEKLDEFWTKFKSLKEDAQNESLVSLMNRKIFASILRLHGPYFGETNEIRDIDFSNINLSYVDLSNMIFINCNFKSSSFYRSNLDSAIFENCNLKNTNFEGAQLETSEFYSSKLNNSNFDRAHLLDAYFNNCDLTGVSFNGTNLLCFEAKDTIIQEIKIDNNTSINNGTFENVDWSRVDVSNLNISIDQTKYFLNCSKGLSKTQVYDAKYSKSNIQEIQDSIFIDLCKLDTINTDSYSNTDLDIFISYAREKEEQANSLADILKRKYVVWWDQHLQDGDKLSDIVRHTICSCKIAIVLFSKEYLIKAWPRYEFFELLRKSRMTQFKLVIVTDNSITNSQIEYNTVKKELQVENSDNIIFVDTIDAIYELITQLI